MDHNGSGVNWSAIQPRRGRWQRSIPQDLREQALVGALVAGVVLGVMAGAAAIGAIANEPFSVFTKEPIEQFAPSKPYAGVLAHLTWFLWVIGGAAAVLASAVLHRMAAADRRIGFLLTSTLLTTALLADDFLLLHDHVLPHFGIPKELPYLVYALVFFVLLLRFRPQIAEGGVLLALGAGAMWAMSLGVDLLDTKLIQERFNVSGHALEDGAKLLGTALWATFLVRASLRAILTAGRGRTLSGP